MTHILRKEEDRCSDPSCTTNNKLSSAYCKDCIQKMFAEPERSQEREIKQETKDFLLSQNCYGRLDINLTYYDLAILLEEYASLVKDEGVRAAKLPKMKVVGYPIYMEEKQYFLAYLNGIKGMVVQGDSFENAVDELMTSIRVKLLYEYNLSQNV